MKTLKIFLNYIPIFALIFAGLYFFYLDVSLDVDNANLILIIVSFLSLIFLFLFRNYIWQKILLRFNVDVSFKIALISGFKPILAKYIPGKIWSSIGESNIISGYGYSLKYCLFISLISQLMIFLSGFFIGLIGIFLFELVILPLYLLYIVIAVIIISFIIFARGFSIPNLSFKFIPKFLKPLGNRKIKPIADIYILYMLQWLVLGSSYYLFIKAIGFDTGLYPIFIQPLANNIGIIAVFAPGGLGVREAVMVGYLSVMEISLKDAATISLLARLWFLVAEIFVFVIGLVLDSKFILSWKKWRLRLYFSLCFKKQTGSKGKPGVD